ncbi:hypothetical protein THL1_4264 [Pseudomonas sp. TCU-HL1]|nr:hypothetical protein THL1_4264 [Pseudomonas sp. TCU-HL1]
MALERGLSVHSGDLHVYLAAVQADQAFLIQPSR